MFAACPFAARGDEPVSPGESTEAQRFEAEKQRFAAQKESQQHGAILNYVLSASRRADQAWKAWHPPASGKLLVTKVKVTVDANGKIATCKIVTPSTSEQEDKSVQDCLGTVAFGSMRAGTTIGYGPVTPDLNSLDFFWTIMSDGSMNMVECTDSPEANEYYTKLLGRRIPPSGDSRIAGGGPAIAVAPSVPRSQGGGAGEGVKGIPDANNNERGRPSASAQAGDDFGPYMADLQRRIKRAWFPPKGNESKRVVVLFKIHKGGELSNLSISHSSGLAIADQAALKAIENAAPFRPLPSGASNDVGIQFTFDYNVFGGGGHGVLVQF